MAGSAAGCAPFVRVATDTPLDEQVKEIATEREELLVALWLLREHNELPEHDGVVQTMAGSWAAKGIQESIEDEVHQSLTEWSVARALGFLGDSIMDAQPSPQDLEEGRQHLELWDQRRREVLADLGVKDRGQHHEAP